MMTRAWARPRPAIGAALALALGLLLAHCSVGGGGAPYLYQGRTLLIAIPWVGFTHVSVVAPLFLGVASAAGAAWWCASRLDWWLVTLSLAAVAIGGGIVGRPHGPLHAAYLSLPPEFQSLTRIAEALIDNELVDEGRAYRERHDTTAVYCEDRADIESGANSLPPGMFDPAKLNGPPTVLRGVLTADEAAAIADTVLGSTMVHNWTYLTEGYPLGEFRLGAYHVSLDCFSR